MYYQKTLRNDSYPYDLEMSFPFLVYVASTITELNLLETSYNKWYQDFHIPDILSTESVQKATWYQGVQKEKGTTWLALYECIDFEFMVDPEKLKKIPKSHPLLGKDKMVWQVANFDMRHYALESIHSHFPSDQGNFTDD